jgi:hypothetical protein
VRTRRAQTSHCVSLLQGLGLPQLQSGTGKSLVPTSLKRTGVTAETCTGNNPPTSEPRGCRICATNHHRVTKASVGEPSKAPAGSTACVCAVGHEMQCEMKYRTAA